jgi:hypothetical protein
MLKTWQLLWQQSKASSFAFITAAVIGVCAHLVKDPTQFQLSIFQVAMATAGAALALTFPGSTEIKDEGYKSIVVRLLAAMIVFVVLYLFTPSMISFIGHG